MATVDFFYNGSILTLQCKENEKLQEILKRFRLKIGSKRINLYCLYNGCLIDENKTFMEIANSDDKQRKKIKILIL